MNELKIIENMIYEIRGKQVMLDSDLAKLYECANGTKSINLAVKRNIERFPNDFYFQLTEEESKNFWFQFETKNTKVETRGGKYNKPYVFTEQGVAMLASVLHTEIAINLSISIMRAFVKMRHCLSNTLLEQQYINNLVLEDHESIKIIQETLGNFKCNDNELFLEGQIFDAYSKILDILKLAKTEIIIIDSYADYNTLNLIKKINTKVTIITNNKKYISEEDIKKYNKEYSNLNIIYSNIFHDRFIIIDNNIIYLLGTSINNIGSKITTIVLLQDKNIIKMLLNKKEDLQ